MLNLIVAHDLNNAIGFNNELLCVLKDDMKHFRETTTNKVVVMGRKTWESINSKPLPNRLNIVLSNQLEIDQDNQEEIVWVESDYRTVIQQAELTDIFIIGGEQIYNLFLPYVERLYVTRINHTFENADVHFSKLDYSEWNILSYKYYRKNSRNDFDFSVSILERKDLHIS